jgi:hypothetical protein
MAASTRDSADAATRSANVAIATESPQLGYEMLRVDSQPSPLAEGKTIHTILIALRNHGRTTAIIEAVFVGWDEGTVKTDDLPKKPNYRLLARAINVPSPAILEYPIRPNEVITWEVMSESDTPGTNQPNKPRVPAVFWQINYRDIFDVRHEVGMIAIGVGERGLHLHSVPNYTYHHRTYPQKKD